MNKIIQYIEKHPFVRGLTIISVFLGVIVSIPTIYHWFINKETTSLLNTQHVSSVDSIKEYFVPTHTIKTTEKNNLITVRNRPLLQSEIEGIKNGSLDANIMDANSTIGQLDDQIWIKLLKHDSGFLKIQYYDGMKVMVGYISDTIALCRIQQMTENKYGIGNGKLIIYTHNPEGIADILIDEQSIGSIMSYLKKGIEPTCENDLSSKNKIIKAGEHSLSATDSKGNKWTAHVTLYEEDCQLINLSYK